MIKAITETAFDYVKMPVTNIQAFQTTRLSPSQRNFFSANPFDDFNLGLHVGDSEHQVKKNRSLLTDYLPKGAQIQWLDQVHGNSVAVVEAFNNTPVVADAVVTSVPRLALAIMTADCLPILLSSSNGDEIAAIHGGWRPLADNIVEHTLNKMRTSSADIYAWLGPSIGRDRFEVGDDVRNRFLGLSQCFSRYFVRNSSGKWLANLSGIAEAMLTQSGVKHIELLNVCTFNNSERYYSYRRENKTGRMASIICIR